MMAIICLLWSQTACSLEQVLGLGKEAWLVETVMSRVLEGIKTRVLGRKAEVPKGLTGGFGATGVSRALLQQPWVLTLTS